MKNIYHLSLITLFVFCNVKLQAQTIWTGADFTFSKVGNADWTLPENQDILTDKVSITRQNKRPIYNYNWWQDNFNQDPLNSDLEADFHNYSMTTLSFTPTGGTKGIRWALLDDTGSTKDWSGYNFGVLGNPTNFYSFKNIIEIIEILEEETGDFSTINVVDDFTVSFNGTNFDDPQEINKLIVGKKFGIWLVEDDIYLTLTLNAWGSNNSGGSFSYTRSTDHTLNTSEFNMDKGITLYPNPSNGFIRISNITSKKSYSIYNILGAEMKSGTIDGNKQIDIRELTNGLYFLKIEKGNIIKFIKD